MGRNIIRVIRDSASEIIFHRKQKFQRTQSKRIRVQVVIAETGIGINLPVSQIMSSTLHLKLSHRIAHPAIYKHIHLATAAEKLCIVIIRLGIDLKRLEREKGKPGVRGHIVYRHR